MSVEDLVYYLLYEHGVLVIPGTSFSELMGRDHVRISFATKMENVVEGSRTIVEALRLKAG